MGADIHLFLEYRTNGSTYGWESMTTEEFAIVRYYRFFALLADVRAEAGEKPIYELRGLPSVLSFWVKNRWDDDSDWHSASWLTPDEFETVCAESNANIDALGVLALARFLEGHDMETRLVFWFDN